MGTYDGANINYYVNGEKVGTLACAKPAEESAESLKIGHSKMFGNKWDFVGAIDELRIYDRALSDAEVMQNRDASTAAVDSSDKLSSRWGAIKSVY